MARRGRRNRRNIPDEHVELTVDHLSHEGRGVANNDGKVAFVDGSLPGERVRAKYLDSRARFDQLSVVDVKQASPDRVSAQCAYFNLCGGCTLQHLSAEAQIVFKQDLLLDQLCHIIGVDRSRFEILQIQRGDAYQYRRKARLGVRYVAKKGGALVGFREKHNTFITEMDDCQVLVKPIASLIQPLKKLVDDLDARLSIPQFEVAAGKSANGVDRVALVMRHLETLNSSDREKIRSFAETLGCDFYLQPKGIDSVTLLWPEDGEERLWYELPDHNLTMKFHPMDFVQVNEKINNRAIKLAIKLLDLDPQDVVLDLFCGLGNFSLPIARYCQQVTGIEGNQDMVGRAQENAAFNNVDNVGFHTVNLYGQPENQSWREERFDKILLDPPRSGALELIDWMTDTRAKKIVYISCNPATLTRDAARLIDKGYALKRVGVMDMFPQTAHVESIAEFELTQ